MLSTDDLDKKENQSIDDIIQAGAAEIAVDDLELNNKAPITQAVDKNSEVQAMNR